MPGSNHWPRDSFTRRAEAQADATTTTSAADGTAVLEAATQICMPRGSVVIFTGSTLHGGGANRDGGWRRSALIGYQLGWLRQEHKFFASREVYNRVHELSPRMQKLLGFDGVADQGHDELRCEPGSYAYLSRTPGQVAEQRDSARHSGADTDEPFYHGPLLVPNEPDDKKHGLWLQKLRTQGRL